MWGNYRRTIIETLSDLPRLNPDRILQKTVNMDVLKLVRMGVLSVFSLVPVAGLPAI